MTDRAGNSKVGPRSVSSQLIKPEIHHPSSADRQPGDLGVGDYEQTSVFVAEPAEEVEKMFG